MVGGLPVHPDHIRRISIFRRVMRAAGLTNRITFVGSQSAEDGARNILSTHVVEFARIVGVAIPERRPDGVADVIIGLYECGLRLRIEVSEILADSDRNAKIGQYAEEIRVRQLGTTLVEEKKPANQVPLAYLPGKLQLLTHLVLDVL